MKPRKLPKPAPAVSANPLWPYFLLAAVAFGVYANALGNGFVSDDRLQLVRNPLLTSWSHLPELFQHDIWANTGGGASNYYRPVQATVYLLLHSLFGFNAVVFHLAMVLLHAANTLLVYALALPLLSSRDAALAAGVIFAVHPIHSEAVLWVAALPDTLVTLAVLAALLWFVRAPAVTARTIAGIAALFLLALLTKETGAMLLPLLAGYEFFCVGRSPREMNWRLYAALAGVFGIYLLLRAHALGGLGRAGRHHHLSGATLVWSIADTLGQYFALLVAPVHLNFFHFFEPASLTLGVIATLVLELALVAAIFYWRASLASFALFFILVPLAPALA